MQYVLKILIFISLFFNFLSASAAKTEKIPYTFYLACAGKLKALELRDYDIDFLRKRVSLPTCQTSIQYSTTAIPGSKAILFCNNENNPAGGGGCIKDQYETHCLIWKSWEGIEINFENYEYRIIAEVWYYLYKLKTYEYQTTYGFYTYLVNKYTCYDSEVTAVVQTNAEYEFSFEDYLGYVGIEPWAIKIVLISGNTYVYYADGENSGKKVETYQLSNVDQLYEFSSSTPGLYDIVWAGYGEWEYNKETYDKCHYYIRVCYDTCSSCKTNVEPTSTEHQCLKCKGNRFFKSGTTSCYSKEEIEEGYFYNSETGNWETCYSKCKTCSGLGNESSNRCTSCNSNYPYLLSNGNCVNNIDGYYNNSNEYVPCYERCATCSKGGSDSKHNCNECKKDSNGKYLYHFIYNQEGQCISDNEAPSYTYFHEFNNTYIKCHDKCGTCNSGCWSFSYTKEGGGEVGIKNFHISGVHTNKVQHISNGVYFKITFNMNVKSITGEFVVSVSGKEAVIKKEGFYNGYLSGDNFNSLLSVNVGSDSNKSKLDIIDISFLKCDWAVNVQGNGGDEISWVNKWNDDTTCITCSSGYHYIFNQTGTCISETNKPDDCYLDKTDDTYKKCYDKCGSCSKAGTSSSNNCDECAKSNGKYLYHFIYNQTGQCISESEKCSDCYLDNSDNTYKKCFSTCATCSQSGTESFPNCDTCKNGYHFVYWRPGLCVTPGNENCHCTLDEGDNTYKQCFTRCSSCSIVGNSTNHSCTTCDDGYYFIYNQTGQCISVNEKPDDTYLDDGDSTFKKCYDTCASCSSAGNSTNHKCTHCKSNYHFSSVTSGKCISEEESKAECTCYLDDKDDTYKECYERCGSCSKSGNATQNNCDSCKTGFHKVYNQPGMCIKDNEKPDNTYYDEEDDTYKKCYDICSQCSFKGSATSPNCTKCITGYHLIYNQTGLCVHEGEQNCTCYLDDNDTYKKCYDTCNACSTGGDSNNHNCTACLKYSNGTFKYHFESEGSSNCVENGKSNQFLDENDNTYKDCYETCATCSSLGTADNHLCNSCIDGYSFKENGGKNCYSDSEPHDGYYKDESTDTWKKCYELCATCSSAGTSDNHNCDTCLDGFHWIYNKTKYCISEKNKPSDTYFDESSNTYKKCYETCSTCSTGGTSESHNCDKCSVNSNGEYIYHFASSDSKNCVSNGNDKQYLDESDNTYKDCYETCATCSKGGSSNNHNCKTCISDYSFLEGSSNCVTDDQDHTGYYKDGDTWKKCYVLCETCSAAGTSTDHNCDTCINGYKFIYNQTKFCISESEKPENTYLDGDTYKKCYDTCGSCIQGGDSESNHCLDCGKYENGTYKYHFVHDQSGQCISNEEADQDDYLDETDNTYKDCHENCGSCTMSGNEKNNNCKTCKTNYHWIYNVKGNCVNDSYAYEKFNYTYYNETTDTYEKCYERCWRCYGEGNIKYHRCYNCRSNYHLIYNQTGQCLRPCAKPSDTYLDESDDTYKKCYEKCSTCDHGGDENNHNCTSCAKDSNGNYLYHFIYNQPGQCVSIDVKQDNEYLDEDDNTIKKCFDYCATCTKGGKSALDQNCATCKEGYHWYYKYPGVCTKLQPGGTYYDEEKDSYEKCHDNCLSCNEYGDDENNKCTKCISGYHFVFNLTEGNCIPEKDKDTYCPNCFLGYNDTYRECGRRCKSCTFYDDNKCTECIDGYYKYYNDSLTCVYKNNIPDGYYPNETDKILYPCYSSCKKCSTSGIYENQNCITCISDEYKFWEDTGNCFKNESKEGEYTDGTGTHKCYETCKICSAGKNDSSHNCDVCNEGLHFIGTSKNCTDVQPEHTYLDTSDNTYKECYETCESCEKPGTETDHNCKTCKETYHFIYNQSGLCISENDKCESCYLDKEDDTYKQCYDSCLTCSKGGTSTDNNCDECLPNYHFIYNKTGQCISENNKPDDTYYDEEDKTYKKCYEKCSKCGSSGDDTNHNCISCISGYHWIYNQTAFCIKEGEQPEDTFYDEKDDTYKKCYERCAKCSKAGDLMDHNCDECAKDADGNYIYHFTIDKEKQCISEAETEHDYYLDNKTNTYEECHKNCYYCSKAGTDESNNCDKCNTYYHFIYNQTGQCIKEEDKPNDTYYDEEDDTYKKCYDKCSTCKESGSSTNHNCVTCISGYHLIYNATGQCIPESEKPNDTYYDEKEDTYKKCYDKCTKCTAGGSETNHNCEECADGYHFIYSKPGYCASDEEKCPICFLDEVDNTYHKCYDSCGSCRKAGNSTNHNCDTCKSGYYKIYGNGDNCYPSSEIPNNTYYEEECSCYKECSYRCSSCFREGTDEKSYCSKCASDYHFIYNNTYHCVRKDEVENSTYIDIYDDTIKKCYETCGSCYGHGIPKYHNCKTCAVDSNGNYLYHFTYQQNTSCIPESEKPNGSYLDEEDNKYKQCHNYCLTCSKGGTDEVNNCDSCITTRHFFIDQIEQKNCILPKEAPNNTYLNTENDTYLYCHKNCFYCNKAGTDENNNCETCIDGYHFIYNHTGQCIKEGTQPDDTYLDNCTDTYRKCHERCSKCVTAGSSVYHNCKECAKYENGTYIYHFVYTQAEVCISESEKPNNTYLDEETNTYEKCYTTCATCSNKGNSTTNNCDSCANGYHFIYNQTGQCIKEGEQPDDTYYEEEEDKYEKCYDKCSKCNGKGDSTSHNCITCAEGFHLVYNQPGICIPDSEKPNGTYYDNDTDTYKECYYTCSECNYGGSASNHNCTECAKYENGTYKYYFVYSKEGQCVEEKCSSCFLDEDDFTYERCYDNCKTCSKKGNKTNNNCDSCEKGYHFIYNQTGQCIKEGEQPDDTYYEEEEDKYEKCYDKCSKCNGKGDSTSHNCITCAEGFHLVYNQPGICIPDSEKPNGTYYDNDTDTYKECYYTCSECNYGGSASNHNCTECAKYENGTYKYHFIYSKEGQCVGDEEKCSNCYLDEEDNTYDKCYDKCSECEHRGNKTSQNCSGCVEGYHFIYNLPGVCIPDGSQPDDTYLDNDTYKPCYERCEKCSKAGDSTNHNCDMCKQDENGNYIYHFIYNKPGQCITEDEKPDNTTLDKDDNTYKECHERCQSCSRPGNNENHYCIECKKEGGKYIYHFIYDHPGNCITDDEKYEDTYLDNDTNTYEKCEGSCGKCDDIGKCTMCAKYENGTFKYHFIYNETGKCVGDDEKCPGCFLDEEDNTYKKCYEKCSECDELGNKTNNKCKKCAVYTNGTFSHHFYYVDKDKGNCYNVTEQPDKTYLDEEDNTYKECYEKCAACKYKGNESNHNCTECAKYPNGTYIYHFIYNHTGQCINEGDQPDDTQLNNETNTYEKCHERCGSCYGYGTDKENMCTLCKYTYESGKFTFSAHFYYLDVDKGNCYYDNEKPDGTYLYEENNTYVQCYPRCATCDYNGNDTQHNCTSCVKDDENNTYLYFIEDKPGQCITNGEKPNNTYIENDTIYYCYKTCGKCEEKGNEESHKCTDCLYNETEGKYITHFVYDQFGNCIYDNEQPNRTYLDEEDNTYKECYERCETCSKSGTYEEMNCNLCIKDFDGNIIYYPIRDKPGQCINQEDAPNNTYFDNETEEYVTCYERCSRCNITGNEFQNNCTACYVNVYGKYVYSFIYNQQGQCVDKTEIEENFYLDNQTNTYWPCHERCKTCSKEGTDENNNCDTCAQDEDGNYEYHFVYNHEGQCITEEEKPNGTVLNRTDNTYAPCPEGFIIGEGNDTCKYLVSYTDYLSNLNNSNYVLENLNYNYTNEQEGYSFLITDNTSSIDNITNVIKEIYNMNDETSLLVGLLTTTDENGETTTTVSRVFTDDGTELDIINIDEDYITIQLYFNGTDTLSPETAKFIHDYDNSYDVFDPNNKFYQDLCTSFQNEKGHDVIIEDRIKYYYTNYCGTCKYDGMNYDTNKMACKCSVNGKVFDEKVNFTKTFPINIEIIKCTVESFKGKHIKRNASFFIVLGACLGQAALLGSFFLWGYPQLLSRIKNVANPVKPADRSNKKKITFKIEDNNESGNDNKDSNTHDNKNSDVLSLNNMSVEQSHFNNSMAAMNNTKISKMNYSFVTHKTNDIIATESPISVYKFAYIVSNTEKTYLSMYWEIFKEEYSLCRCIWRKSIFETYAFNFSFYIMYLTFLLMLNGLYLYYNIMHLIFLEKLTTFQYILSPVLACITLQVVLYFPKICIFSYPMFYSVYKNKKKPSEIHNSINKLVKKVKTRMIIFFIIMWLVTLLNVFYLVCFCSIWNGSQAKLYYDFLISLLIFLVITSIIVSIIAALRYYGFHNNNEKILKIQKSLKDFFIFF